MHAVLRLRNSAFPTHTCLRKLDPLHGCSDKSYEIRRFKFDAPIRHIKCIFCPVTAHTVTYNADLMTSQKQKRPEKVIVNAKSAQKLCRKCRTTRVNAFKMLKNGRWCVANALLRCHRCSARSYPKSVSSDGEDFCKVVLAKRQLVQRLMARRLHRSRRESCTRAGAGQCI